ncbi:MAG: YaiI/YqxD family protein [Cyanobacteria bacterium P01_D01_bin.156]
MQIWVDADACPNVIKEILYRAAKRLQIQLTLVANTPIQIPASPHIDSVLVRSGLDVADNHIVKQMTSGDLVITADIPLAANVIEQGGTALNPRGEFYDAGNIRERLSMRNFMETLRNSGVETGGPPPLNHRDREAFANQLDRFLRKHID